MKKALIVSCFDWYEDRVKYISEYFQKEGFDTKIILSDFDHMKKKKNMRFSNIKNVEYVSSLPYKKNISICRVVSHLLFSYKVSIIINNYNPDVVYCLIPPNSLCKKLVSLKKKRRITLFFDVIDLWPESFPKGNTNFFLFKIWKKMRDSYIDLADCIIVECEYYKKTLQLAPHKTKVLHLIKKPIMHSEQFEPFSEDLCLGYLGSINSLIDIDRISQIVSHITQQKKLLVRIVGDGENKDYFIKQLEEAGANVKYYGKIYDLNKLHFILGNCNFGINIYRDNLAVGLTIKSVSYFQIGIPILNSIKGDTEQIIDEYNCGININGKSYDEIVDLMFNYSGTVKNVFDLLFSSENIHNRLLFLKEYLS